MKEVYQEGQGEWIDKKSKFIGKLVYVKSEDEVNQILTSVRKEHYNARHHCYAYILGEEGQIKRSSDDKEPSGTAGKPILETMERNQLSNALLVVIRYFGGVLLGTGGLVHAYQNCAKITIENSILVERHLGYRCMLTTDYGMLGKIQYLLREEEIEILSTEFLETVSLELALLPEQILSLEKQLEALCSGEKCLKKMEQISFAKVNESLIIL